MTGILPGVDRVTGRAGCLAELAHVKQGVDTVNSPSVSGTGADPASVVTDRESSLDPAELVASILAQPEPSGWCPTEVDRSFYLDLMEVILNVAAGWQDERGAIIDPEKGVEHGQTSSRFVA